MTFENVSINREFPHELKVSLVLEAPHVTWREVDGREYYLNASGNVLKAKQEHGVSTDAFLFEKATGTRVALIPGAHVIDREPLEAFEAFREALSQSMRDFSLSKVAYDPTDPQTLNIVTNEGWTIIVDQNTNMASAIATLTKVLRETIGVNRLKLQYVDLRVENKVFYK